MIFYIRYTKKIFYYKITLYVIISYFLHDYLFFQWQNRWMVRRGEWKLFYNLRLPKEEAQETQNLFLASLNDSEPEKYNYAQDKGNIVDQLKNAYESWKKEVFLDTGI